MKTTSLRALSYFLVEVVPFWRLAQRPRKAFPQELAQFHDVDYVEFLQTVQPDAQEVLPFPPRKALPVRGRHVRWCRSTITTTRARMRTMRN